jgi:Holliday junction resolvasome RuvABC endonuclease subunit
MGKEEKKASKEKIILGIDPGTNIMGYGLILIEGKSTAYFNLASSISKSTVRMN